VICTRPSRVSGNVPGAVVSPGFTWHHFPPLPFDDRGAVASHRSYLTPAAGPETSGPASSEGRQSMGPGRGHALWPVRILALGPRPAMRHHLAGVLPVAMKQPARCGKVRLAGGRDSTSRAQPGDTAPPASAAAARDYLQRGTTPAELAAAERAAVVAEDGGAQTKVPVFRPCRRCAMPGRHVSVFVAGRCRVPAAGSRRLSSQEGRR